MKNKIPLSLGILTLAACFAWYLAASRDFIAIVYSETLLRDDLPDGRAGNQQLATIAERYLVDELTKRYHISISHESVEKFV